MGQGPSTKEVDPNQPSTRNLALKTKIAPLQPEPPHSTSDVPAEAETLTPQTPSADEWEFQLTPYIWFEGLEGDVGVGNLIASVDVKFRDIIDELNFGLMGTFEARKGKLVIATDALYVKLTDNNATPGPLFSNVEVELKQFMFEPKVAYRAVEQRAGTVDVFAGIRYWHMRTNLDFAPNILPATSVSRSKNWVDPIVGTRLKVNLSPKFFAFGKGDIGGFGAGSDFTWELLGGVGYNINERFSLLGGYRHLSVDYQKDGFLYDLASKGFFTGVGIRF
jgi:hypothetical protein